MSDLGIVTIGRNEGERLRCCLNSLIGHGLPVVYVDSNSTDGSVALARSLGVEVVELDVSLPFTAARARNAGFARLEQCEPGVEFVQFVDGDCEVVPGWLDRARAVLKERPDVARGLRPSSRAVPRTNRSTTGWLTSSGTRRSERASIAAVTSLCGSRHCARSVDTTRR